MALTYKVSGGGGDFKSVPAGSHIAVCDMVVDLGLQPGSALYPDPKHQVYLRFETPNERIEYERDGKKQEGPHVIGITFTASMHEKANLRKQLEGWRAKRFTDEEAAVFDVAGVLGKGCMLNVIAKEKGDKTYMNIAGISKLPTGVPMPKAENTLILFSEDNTESWDKLPEWLQKKINARIKPAASNATGNYAESGEYDYIDQLTDSIEDHEVIPF